MIFKPSYSTIGPNFLEFEEHTTLKGYNTKKLTHNNTNNMQWWVCFAPTHTMKNGMLRSNAFPLSIMTTSCLILLAPQRGHESN